MNTQPSSQHAERQYLHTLVAGAWLPLVQSTIFAGVIGIVVLTIAYFVFDARDPFKWSILSFVGTWAYMIWMSIRHWWSLTTVEQILQRDINGDGVIGEATPQPSAKPRRVIVELYKVKEDGHIQVGDVSNLVKLSCSDEQLQTLAMGLENGLPFSEKQWCGKDKPFSTDDFRSLRAEMLANGLTEYVNDKDKRQGVRLTDAGRAVMSEYSSPLPRPEV